MVTKSSYLSQSLHPCQLSYSKTHKLPPKQVLGITLCLLPLPRSSQNWKNTTISSKHHPEVEAETHTETPGWAWAA